MGKYSLYMVLGASLYFLTMGRNMTQYATEAYANYLLYAARTNAHSISVSAANICANWIFLDTVAGNIAYNNINLNGGTFSVSSVDIVGTPRKVITAVASFPTNLPKHILQPYTKDTTGMIRDTCVVILQPSGYSKYAYYSVIEGSINWITGDTIWGPFHTQDKITYSGNPVFFGKVTTNKGKTGSGSPKFLGGYQAAVNVPLNPKSLLIIRQAALDSGRYFKKDSLRLIFKGDSVTWHFGKKPDTTKLIKDFTRCGVIFVDSNIIRLSGVCHGRVTVCSFSSTTAFGEIYIDDDIKYTDDPRYVPGAKNMLGLVASNEIWATENAANNSNIVIQAAMFSLNYGFGAQNYASRPVSGKIFLLGGITQKQRLAVGTFSGSTIRTGYGKSYQYDTRLFTDAPPFFPTTGRYEIISWLE